MEDTHVAQHHLVDDQAVKVLCEILKENNAINQSSGLKSEKIRVLMAAKYNKYAKNTRGQDGFIKSLLNKAESGGYIECVKQPNGPNYIVYLLNKISGVNELHVKLEKNSNSRSGEFIALLKSHNMGPFFKIRHLLFSKMLDILQNKGNIRPSRLLSLVITEVKNESESKNQPWRFMRIFIEKITRENSVFLDSDGNAFNFSLDNDSQKFVVKIVGDWENKVDDYLILFLIKHKKDITTSDYMQIAGAIYGSRSEDSEDRVRAAVQRLFHSRKITEREDTYVLEAVETV